MIMKVCEKKWGNLNKCLKFSLLSSISKIFEAVNAILGQKFCCHALDSHRKGCTIQLVTMTLVFYIKKNATVFPVSMPTEPRPCDYTHGVFKRESCETHTRSKPKVQFMELTTLFVCERELTCDRVRVHVWKLSLSIRYGHTIPLCMWRTWTLLLLFLLIDVQCAHYYAAN